MRRAFLAAICAGLVALFGGAPPAQAAFDDPLFFYTPPVAAQPAVPPPAGYLDGPCGLTVSSGGSFYVSDYYHRAIDAFTSAPEYSSQPLAAPGPFGDHTGPLDDPCGLAFGAGGTLYLNNYHRDVVRFPAPLSIASAAVIDSGDPTDPFANPTGVAVEAATNRVYVDDRTYVSVYDSAGNPVLSGSDPLRIGLGSLGDGYGIAVSGFPATSGRVYVPDAQSKTVKAYSPAVSTTTPVQTLEGPSGSGFGSLRDSAIAVDNSTGEIYVTDTLGPQFTERPEASVYVFAPNGTFEGRLKHNTIDAAPTGLAVDNSPTATQGRVYVTSGITENAGIYAYPPGAATSAVLPPLGSASAAADQPSATPALAAKRAGSEPAAPGASEGSEPGATSSSVSQKGNLRVSVAGGLRPKRLPRQGTAPISVTVSGQISTTDESLPPLLRTIRIDLNRHGKIDYTGLPTCPFDAIQPGSSSHALASCRSSLIGTGSFGADITLAGQEPYPTEGKLLVFNGVRKGKPVLYGHIYSPRPFATSFVIVFTLAKLGHGLYGTSLIAPLPEGMKTWGRLTGIQMTLSRRYSYKGERHSYISSGCPAPEGFGKAVFSLARASFAFEGGKKLGSVLSGTCRAGG